MGMCNKMIQDVRLTCRRVNGMHVRPWSILCGITVLYQNMCEGSTIKVRGTAADIRSMTDLMLLHVIYGDTVDLHLETDTEETATLIIEAAEEALSDCTLWKQCPWQSEKDR